VAGKRQTRLHLGQGFSKPDKTGVLAFFDNKGKVYTNYVPRGMTVNEDYIVGALKKCLKALHQKWPDLVPREWIFLQDQGSGSHPTENAGIPGQKSPQLVPHPFQSPNLAHADFLFLPILKRGLAGQTLSLDEFKMKLEGSLRW
jgi:hypothetical protein